MEIRDRVALVTGAGTGIGRASAMALAAAGAAVMVADMDDIGGTATVRQIEEELGGAAAFVKVDVAWPHDVRTMFSAAEATFGGVDIVHNNAGLIGGEPIWPEAELERIMKVITVNLGGVAMGTQEGIKALRKRGGGCIVNTASTAALRPMPTDPVYSATKAGVVRITESCAGLADEGIRHRRHGHDQPAHRRRHPARRLVAARPRGREDALTRGRGGCGAGAHPRRQRRRRGPRGEQRMSEARARAAESGGWSERMARGAGSGDR